MDEPKAGQATGQAASTAPNGLVKGETAPDKGYSRIGDVWVRPSLLTAETAQELADKRLTDLLAKVKQPDGPDLTALNVDDVIDHPERYGFAWAYAGGVRRAKIDNVCPLAPWAVITDVELFVASFGWSYILDGVNGSNSPRTASVDRAGTKAAERQSLADRHNFVNDLRGMMREVVTLDLMGQSIKRNAPKWDGADGVTYFDLTAMAAADVVYFVELFGKGGIPAGAALPMAKNATADRIRKLGGDPTAVQGLVTA